MGDHEGAALPRLAVGDDGDLERLLDRRVLGAVDEAGEVAAVLVHEAGLLEPRAWPRARTRRRCRGRRRARRLLRCRASTPRGRAAWRARRAPVTLDGLERRRASAGASSGRRRRQRSAPKPTTMFDPPAVTGRLAQAAHRGGDRLVGSAGVGDRTRGGSANGCPGRRCRAAGRAMASSRPRPRTSERGGQEHMRLRSP